nr:immunoglobulin heavy chain junction region [Macaca mulatta]MOY18545.1 immunoglobulin heavy chain junction region [Macaca mulatta]MOY18599.1 immunoglobulin heavy chain junction region [Macaca mulatta]MOY18989.1 immunoglobulin heavy chain junction region [Macaca mulatta]MOY19575.1 immunoglobulin heavy chain junction region [Macaca mulatta]
CTGFVLTAPYGVDSW